jgi:Ni,Fe-hydrogenase III small subunit/uncharacterized Fe-S cluster protein YjdI
MSQWILKGLGTGIKTTRYPDRAEDAAGITPGRPGGGEVATAAALVARCPTGALTRRGAEVDVDYRRCVHCYRCVRGTETALPWQSTYEWGGRGAGETDAPLFGRAFGRSLHILVVDAGDCGACLNEVKQLGNPYYNMHRLGFFITPTPRHADVLLVVGTVTDHMREALLKIHAAIPEPKRVVAVGACALSGGAFTGSFACENGAACVLPVDVEVPGNPPPPLAILHGLLVAAGRKPAAPLASRARPAEEEA